LTVFPATTNRLPRLALLEGLSNEELGVVSKAMHLRTLDVGKMISATGEPLIGAGILVRGRLELLTPPPRRRLALIEPGEAFGLTALVTEGPQILGCRAISKSAIITFRREDFLRLAALPGSLGLHMVTQLLAQLARQLRRMDDTLKDLETPDPAVATAPSPQPEVPGPAPTETPRGRPTRPMRPRRLSGETGEQVLSLVQQYSVKAGLEDLDRVRVVRTGYQRLNEFGAPSYRRR
jgi:CRP-like cAMP-binding protein